MYLPSQKYLNFSNKELCLHYEANSSISSQLTIKPEGLKHYYELEHPVFLLSNNYINQKP